MKANEKNERIEYLRAIAVFAVVLIHTVNSGLIYSGENHTALVFAFFNGIRDWAYWGVPVFLLITGQLLLDPQKVITVSKIYKKYIFRMVLVLLIFGTSFSFMELVLNERNISIAMVGKALSKTMEGDTWAHMWYVYALIGIYLLLPFFRAGVRSLANKELQYVLGVLIVFVMILPILKSVFHFDFGVKLVVERYYLIYLLLGECKRRGMYQLKKSTAIMLLGITSVLIVLLSSIMCFYDVEINGMFGAGSILVLIVAWSLVSVMDNVVIGNKIVRRILLELADKSFGIYLVHMVFINCIYQLLHIDIMILWTALILLPVLVIGNIIFSYGVTWILKKMPVFRKII